MSNIVTVTINPAIDIFTTVARVEPRRKLRCGEARRDPGGGGINVARAVKRLDGTARAIYPAGGPMGEMLRRLLDKEGVESIAIEIGADTREDFTVYESGTGKEYRFVLPGPSLAPAERAALVAGLSAIDPAPEFAVISGSLAPDMPVACLAELVRAAKTKGARAVVDTSGPALKAALDEGVYLVKPNFREFCDYIGRALSNEAEMARAAQGLIESGRVEMVALTLGERGALLVSRDLVLRGAAPKLQPVSTVGAGDSFLAAMVSSLARGRGLAECLRYAIAAGTAALLAPGTELCRNDDVERLLPEVKIEILAGAGS